MNRQPPPIRSGYRSFRPVTPRWNDIDVFGHVNNAEFYAFFDSTVLAYLHGVGAVSARSGQQAVLVVESGARFHREVLFTDRVEVGLRVAHLGTSSVRWELGVFCNDIADAAVDGFLVHVFADRESRRPTPIPAPLREQFELLRANEREEHAIG